MPVGHRCYCSSFVLDIAARCPAYECLAFWPRKFLHTFIEFFCRNSILSCQFNPIILNFQRVDHEHEYFSNFFPSYPNPTHLTIRSVQISLNNFSGSSLDFMPIGDKKLDRLTIVLSYEMLL